MKRQINWLGVLRRRRSGLGRFVLAFFAVATVTMTGAPCFAMAAGAHVAPAVHDDGMHTGMTMVAHDHSHFAHEHSASSPHGSADPSLPHGSADPAHQCPHCPLAAPMSGYTATASGSHAACAGLAGASDQAQAGVTVLPFKHIAAAPLFEPPASTVLRPPGVVRAFLPPALARPSVPLNVRHCVFLI